MLDAVAEIVREMTLTMVWLGAEVVVVSIGLALVVASIRTALRRPPPLRSPQGPRAEVGLRPPPVNHRAEPGSGRPPRQARAGPHVVTPHPQGRDVPAPAGARHGRLP
jgi:hypothetical protein